MKALEIPVERLRTVLWYEPWSGDFYWRAKIADKVVVGEKAGNDTGRRDVRISIDGVLYAGHRLAFAWMTGEQPPNIIDHRDLDTRNNRWDNIRPATGTLNNANRSQPKNNTSGFKGVYYYPDRKKPWLARLQHEGTLRLNRYFATQDEAVAAYRAAALEWFGEFARP